MEEKLLQHSFTGKRYDQMRAFMVNIWRSEAKYKIFMARRAFNLNYAFMEICDARKDDTLITDGIMSNTALLLCAEEIAGYYKRSKQFPRILIVDDLLFHGRGIIKLLDNFETLIVEFLEKDSIKENKTIIHEKLFSAVNIYVFAQNREGLLVDRHYALKSELHLPMNELRGLSQQISDALQNCGIANTSYVLSVALSSYDSRELNFGGNAFEYSRLFRYRGYSQLYYYKFNNNLLSTIRTNIPVNRQRLDRMFTSLVIFGDIISGDFDELCNMIAGQLDIIIPYSRIAEILRYHNDKLARPKAQMLSFLLSIECFADFYREKISTDSMRLYHIFLKSDYKKIVTNFDKVMLLQYEIVGLFKHICFEGVPEYTISDMVSNYVQNIRGTEEKSAVPCFRMGGVENIEESRSLYTAAEDIFYEVGINAERDAASYIYEQKKFEPTQSASDVLRLNQYLGIMNKDSFKSIGCILKLMDSGLLSMNMEKNRDNIQCVLKSGELAMYVVPRRFSVFISALAIVERNSQKRNIDLRIAISRFIEYLQEHCYEQNGCSTDDDVGLLRQLKESKGTLLYMYVSGQFFQDWDTELLTEGDRIDTIEEQYGRYGISQYQTKLWNETVRRKYYAYCAREFMHSNECRRVRI